MHWIGWIVAGVFGFNVLFFGILAVIHEIEKRRDRNR